MATPRKTSTESGSEREQSDVLYWHRMNVARWWWSAYCPKDIKEDTAVRITCIGEALAERGQLPTGPLGEIPKAPWPRRPDNIVEIPEPLLKRYGVYGEAERTWRYPQ